MEPQKRMLVFRRACLVSVFLALSIADGTQGANYYVGAGIADATGPAADVNMMGYANPAQTTHGIHMRQYARAFVVASSLNGPRIVFVNLEAGWADGAVKREAVKKIQKELGSQVYTERNLCTSGTHTHSGVGGYSQYLLFGITALGFNKQAFDAQVDAIAKSVIMAHKSMRPADIYLNVGELLDSNINRSPTSYLNNPAEERARYKYDTDKNMTVLRFVGEDGKDIGMLNWFAVHGTSMNNTNEKISSDNKGYASQLFESDFNKGALPGKGQFVASFAQSNLGDVSPNTRGPHCLDTGLPCDTVHSTCNGKNELCVAFGPGKDMVESTEIIGRNQYNKALELYKSATTKLSGPVDFRHSYADMTKQVVTLSDGGKATTCKTSMGYSFAAGTTDGPGAFDFTQGSNSTNPFWNIVRDLIHTPSPELIKCQSPKPILLPTGEIREPYLWQPEIVDTQLLRIGEFIIIAVPGEFTTMSGRRLREVVQRTAIQSGMPANTSVVIAGLANEYSDYITTFEEYQAQRYEAASTSYGPHTLSAYLQLYTNLTIHLAKNQSSPAGPAPPDLLGKQLSLLPGVFRDGLPSGRSFGDVVKDVGPSYTPGSTVTVRFQSANPRNDLIETFLLVEQQMTKVPEFLGVMDGPRTENGDLHQLSGKRYSHHLSGPHTDLDPNWRVVCTDGCWETKFDWIRTNLLESHSEALITWQIPRDVQPGNYRIRHFGTAKPSLFEKNLKPFNGTSKTFTVSQ